MARHAFTGHDLLRLQDDCAWEAGVAEWRKVIEALGPEAFFGETDVQRQAYVLWQALPGETMRYDDDDERLKYWGYPITKQVWSTVPHTLERIGTRDIIEHIEQALCRRFIMHDCELKTVPEDFRPAFESAMEGWAQHMTDAYAEHLIRCAEEGTD